MTPNTDTLYSFEWADLRSEPLVLKVPEDKDKRYYSFQFIDLYTHNFAYVGTRTTGFGPGHYLLAGPTWTGDVPKEVNQAFISEGNFVLVAGRTAVNGEKDLAKTNEFQNQYQVIRSARVPRPSGAKARPADHVPALGCEKGRHRRLHPLRRTSSYRRRSRTRRTLRRSSASPGSESDQGRNPIPSASTPRSGRPSRKASPAR